MICPYIYYIGIAATDNLLDDSQHQRVRIGISKYCAKNAPPYLLCQKYRYACIVSANTFQG